MCGSLPYMSPRVGGGVVAGIALVVAVCWTWRRVRSTCSEKEAKASRVRHGREGKVHGE